MSIRVTVPAPSREPDCIRLRIKKEGFSLFSCVAKLRTIPLKERNWTQIAYNVLQCQETTNVTVDVKKLIEKSRKRPLTFCMDCMRGHKVQYKIRKSGWWFIDLIYQELLTVINVTYPDQIQVTCWSEAAVGQEISQTTNKEHRWLWIPTKDMHQPAQVAKFSNVSNSRPLFRDVQVPNQAKSGRQSVTPPKFTQHLRRQSTEPPKAIQEASDVIPESNAKVNDTQTLDVKSPRQVRNEESESLFINLSRDNTTQVKAGNTEKEDLLPQSLPRTRPRRYTMWINWCVANIIPPATIYFVLLDFLKPALGGELKSPVPLLMWLLMCLNCAAFYYSSWISPGQVLEEDWSVWKKTDTWRKCKYCDIHVPPVARHCPVCEICIWERDHHCYVIGNCVGRDNVKAFLMLCIVAWTCALACLSLTVADRFIYKEDFVPHDWVIIIGSLVMLVLCIFLYTNVRKRRTRWRKRFPKYFD